MYLRQDKMTNQERLQALLQYKKPDRIPIGSMGLLEFSAYNAGSPKFLNYTDAKMSFSSQKATTELYGWDGIPMHMDNIVLAPYDFGGGVRLPKMENQMGISLTHLPVRAKGDVDMLTIPDPKSAGRIAITKDFASIQKENGLPVWFMIRSPLNMGADMCGLELFCRWMYKEPDLCHELIELALIHTFNVMRDWIGTFGHDDFFVYIASAVESNQIISPKQFEKFALPYHAKLQLGLRNLGINRFAFHICGDQNLNLPYLSEFAANPDGWQHPSILSFGHEVDLEDAAKYFPDDIIMGNIEPAIFQVGTPQQVYEHCRKCIEKGKKIRGGFILAPGCALPPKSPPYNVWMMTKAVNDFGWYSRISGKVRQ